MRVETGQRAVSFYGDKGFLYKANHQPAHLALSVLVPLKTEKIFNETQLYKAVYNIPWERYMSAKDTLSVDATVNSGKIHQQPLRSPEDQGRGCGPHTRQDERPAQCGPRSSHSADKHTHQRPYDDRFAGQFSSGYTSGDTGTATNMAPINEVLAAGLVMLSGWKGGSNFIDPMCGSGTILIEAAMIAANIPAGINKKEFGFEKWRDFDPELFEKMREISLKKMRDRA